MSPRNSQRSTSIVCFLTILTLTLGVTRIVKAEEEETGDEEQVQEQTTKESSRPQQEPKKKTKKKDRRKFITDHPDRIDAGIFYVAAAVGGNFYVEPQYNAVTGAATGDYFNDFGFQGGAYFDYDYSQLTENVPFALRGFVGYKYILNSVHCFSFDGMVRRMMQLSENVTFGIGMGGSAALWMRKVTSTSRSEETIFLPSLLIGAGFEFNPFMIDFKWLVNRLGGDNTITGLELYFGFRL